MALDNGVSTVDARDGLSVEHIIRLRIMGTSASIAFLETLIALTD